MSIISTPKFRLSSDSSSESDEMDWKPKRTSRFAPRRTSAVGRKPKYMTSSSSDSESDELLPKRKSKKRRRESYSAPEEESDSVDSSESFDFKQAMIDEEDQRKEDKKFERISQPSKRKNFHRYDFLPGTREKLMKKQNFRAKKKKKGSHRPRRGSMDDTFGGRFQLINKGNKWIEDRDFTGDEHRPIIDHIQDVEAEIQAYDSEEIYSDEHSEDYKDTFKQFNYSDTDNLRILPKAIDKDPKQNPTYRTDTIPDRMVKKERKRWKANYGKYKQELTDPKSQVSELLKRRRKKTKKGPTKPKKKRKVESSSSGSST